MAQSPEGAHVAAADVRRGVAQLDLVVVGEPLELFDLAGVVCFQLVLFVAGSLNLDVLRQCVIRGISRVIGFSPSIALVVIMIRQSCPALHTLQHIIGSFLRAWKWGTSLDGPVELVMLVGESLDFVDLIVHVGKSLVSPVKNLGKSLLFPHVFIVFIILKRLPRLRFF